MGTKITMNGSKRKPTSTKSYADVDRHAHRHTQTRTWLNRILQTHACQWTVSWWTHRWSSNRLMGRDENLHAPSLSAVQRWTHAQVRQTDERKHEQTARAVQGERGRRSGVTKNQKDNTIFHHSLLMSSLMSHLFGNFR